MDNNIIENEDLATEKACWQAFVTSGKPGYYMLYKALHKNADKKN